MKIVFLPIITFLLMTLSFPVTGQSIYQHQRDSILQELPQLQGEAKIMAYEQLCLLPYPDEEAETIFAYRKALIHEAQKQGHTRYEAVSRVNELYDYYNFNKPELFFQVADETIGFLKRNEEWDYYYAACQVLIEMYLLHGKPDKAISYTRSMYNEAEQQSNDFGMGTAAFNLALIYYRQHRLEDAEYYYRETIRLHQQTSNRALLYEAYSSLSDLLVHQERFSEALENQKLWRKVRENDKQGAIHIDLCNYYSSFVRIYIGLEDYDQAEHYCKLAEEQSVGNEISLIPLYFYQALIHSEREEYQKAVELCNRALNSPEIASQHQFSLNIYKLKAKCLCMMENPEEGSRLYEYAFALSDSLQFTEQEREINSLRVEYDLFRVTAQKEANRNYMLMAMGGCVLLFAALLIYIIYSRRLKAKNKSLYRQIQERLHKEKEAENALVRIPEENLSREMQLFVRLQERMQAEELFTEPDINRKNLADALGTNEVYLADAIREGCGATFSTYIAQWRLNYALELLANHPELTLEAVALDSGHGSYSSFYRAFTKVYGMNPAEYRKLSVAKK